VGTKCKEKCDKDVDNMAKTKNNFYVERTEESYNRAGNRAEVK
jgi:hypothetical protein